MRLEMGQFHEHLDGPGGVSKTVGAVESHADRRQNSRTMVFPGILFYYLLYGGYLALLRLLSHTSSSQNRELIIERLGWTDLYSYLSWIIRHFGMPKSATLVVESR